jgi:outer membrane protein TolC
MRLETTAAAIAAEAAVTQARIALNVLFNLPGDAIWNLDRAHVAIEQFWGDYDIVRSRTTTPRDEDVFVDKLAKVALSENPMIDVIESDLAVDKSRLDQTSSRILPTIGFQARLNWADSMNAETIAGEENTTWSLGAYLEMPLFDGFKRNREKAALQSEISALEFQRDHVRLEIMGRTRQGATHVLGAMRQMPPLAAAAERSDNNLAMVMERYEKDQNALADMLDAYSSSLNARLALTDRRYDVYRAMAETVHAMGLSSYARNSNFRELFFSTIR